MLILALYSRTTEGIPFRIHIVTNSIQNEQASTASTAPTAELPMSAFNPYDSQLPIKDVADRRIVKCLFQAPSKDKPAPYANSYIAIPDYINETVITANLSALVPFITTYLQDVENKMIKEHHKSGVTRLSDSSFTIDAIIASLEASGTGTRLNGEDIRSWFTANVEDSLTDSFALRMGTSLDTADAEQLAKLDAIATAYKAKFVSLASPKASLQVADITSLRKVIEITESGSMGLGKRLDEKLVKLQTPPEVTLLESL